ncbi:MAG: HAD family hydrolase [Anaerolineaceae bacterium]|nr:MAG: HAD family hydrolase [Anaerolineaceae bacterium]
MISPNGIKSILFDLDGTLRIHLPSGGEVFNAYALSLGIALHPEDLTRAARWEHYYFAQSPEIKADGEKFKSQKFENDSFWINFGRRRLIVLGCSPVQAVELAPQFSAHMAEHYKPEVRVPEKVPALLADLKNAGYTLGMVSNRDKPFDEQLTEMGLREFFHFTLAAGEVNSFKPDRVIFEAALQRAGTSASETMYVGDNFFADVVGSRRAGLRPVLYDPRGLFPDAECPVITSFDQLPALL